LLSTEGGEVTVRAELRLRRVFRGVSGAKRWDAPDIVMEERQVTFAARPRRSLYLPLAGR
jgi:hypothetical protein